MGCVCGWTGFPFTDPMKIGEMTPFYTAHLGPVSFQFP